jgi:hypothetical protein
MIAFGSSAWIDENGQQLYKFYGHTDTRGMTPIARFFTVFWGNMNPILGIIRKSDLDQALPLPSTAGSDLILLSKLVLKGDFVHATRTQWQRREFRHESNHTEKLKRYRSSEFGLSHSLLDRYFPLLRLPLELTRTVIHSDLKMLEKLAVLLILIVSLPIRYLEGKKSLKVETEDAQQRSAT